MVSSRSGGGNAGIQGVAESSVLLLVEEIAVTNVLVRIVTRERLWGHFLVRVTEVDVPHIVSIVQ